MIAGLHEGDVTSESYLVAVANNFSRGWTALDLSLDRMDVMLTSFVLQHTIDSRREGPPIPRRLWVIHRHSLVSI